MHKEKLQNSPQAQECYPLRETITAAHSLSNLHGFPVNGQEGGLLAGQLFGALDSTLFLTSELLPLPGVRPLPYLLFN